MVSAETALLRRHSSSQESRRTLLLPMTLFAAMCLFVGVVVSLSSSSGAVVLTTKLPKNVAELEAMSRHLVKTDASAAFKASVRAGKQNALLQGSEMGKQILAELDSSGQGADDAQTMHVAKAAVKRLFTKKDATRAASKKTHKDEARELRKKAANVETKEELAALHKTMSSGQSKAHKLKEEVAKLTSKVHSDHSEISRLRHEVHQKREHLMRLSIHGRKRVESKASAESQEKLLISEAERLDKKSAKLMARAAKLKEKNGPVKESQLSSKAQSFVAKNDKVIAAYKAKQAMARAMEDKAKATMTKAHETRKRALTMMHNAGALLSDASSSSLNTAAVKKMRAKSGAETEKAVSLLMSTRKLAHLGTTEQKKAQTMDMQVTKLARKYHAAKMSNHLLKHPITKNSLTPKSLKPHGLVKAKADEQRARRDRIRAAHLRTEAKNVKLAVASEAPAHATTVLSLATATKKNRALAYQQDLAKASARRRLERQEASMARGLGREMAERTKLEADAKSRDKRLKLVQVRHPPAFNTSNHRSIITRPHHDHTVSLHHHHHPMHPHVAQRELADQNQRLNFDNAVQGRLQASLQD